MFMKGMGAMLFGSRSTRRAIAPHALYKHGALLRTTCSDLP